MDFRKGASILQSIGERLAHVRKNILSMNQKEFAQLVGISQGALSDAENNNRGLSMEAIIKLMKYSKSDISFSCDWILTGAKEEPIGLTSDETELLKTYNKLDRRGQHRVHTVIYEELDRSVAGENKKESVG